VGVLLWGVLGGLAAEFVGIYELRHHDPSNWPSYMRNRWFWIFSAIMAIIGGALAYAYSDSGSDISPVLAINVGASAPLILRQAKRAAPTIEPGSIG
jgi:hypothetical protein